MYNETFLPTVFDLQILTDAGMIGSTTLDSASIGFNVDSVDITCGQWATLLTKLYSARRVTINVDEMTWNMDLIKNQLGATSETKKVNVVTKPKFYTSSTDDETTYKFTLDEEPISTDSYLTIVDVETGNTVAKTSGYTITGKDVTIVGANAPKQYLVKGFLYETASAVEVISITDNTFPEGVKCILSTVEVNKKQKAVNHVQIHFDNALPDGNFTINTTSAVGANTSGFTFSVTRPEGSNGELGRIIKIPISA